MSASTAKRSTRFHFALSPLRNLVDADVIVLGSAAAIEPGQLQQVLDLIEPDAYVVKQLPDHPTIGAVAVRRSVLSAAWLYQLVDAVQSALEAIMVPDLLWMGSVNIEIEARTEIDAPDMHDAQ